MMHNQHSPDFHFTLRDGTDIKSIKNLIKAIKTMDEIVFATHVNNKKNDFAEWIRLVKGDIKEAKKLDKLKDRNKILAELEKIA